MENQVQKLWDQLESMIPVIVGYTGRAIAAILVLVVGWWIINLVVKSLSRGMTARKVEPTLEGFLLSVVTMLLRALLLISVASMVGIATTSFVAVLGAAGLAVGLALQGSLANFAGGVLILLFRPFKAGDSITAGGVTGTVVSIEMFRTVLRAANKDIIYVPNGTLSNNVVVNTTEYDTRVASIALSIDYDDDIDKAREILLGLFEDDAQVASAPAPSVSFLPQPVNIDVSISFSCSTGVLAGLKAKYAEAAIKALKKEGFRLGTTSRTAPVQNG